MVKGNFRRFIKLYVRPFSGRLALVLVLAGVSSSYPFVLGYISKLTVDRVLQLRPHTTPKADPDAIVLPSYTPPHRDPNAVLPNFGKADDFGPEKTKAEKLYWLWIIFFIYLVVRFSFAGLNWFYNYNVSFIGQRIVFRIRKDLHEKLQKLQMTFFDRQQTGKIMSRVLDDVGLLQNAVSGTFVQMVRNISRILIGTAVLLTLDLRLACLALLALPLYVVTYKAFLREIMRASLRMREVYSDAYGILEERVRGIRVVRSYARKRGEIRIFFKKVAETFRVSLRRSLLNAGLGAACALISMMATALVFYWGALSVKNGVMTVGDLVYFNMALGNLFSPLVALTQVNSTLQEMVVVIARVFEVMDEEILIQDRPGAVALSRIKGRVAFQNVSFRYREDGDDVLKDLDFEVKPGMSVALVGPSGSGKSTLVSLLMRLYEPTEGRILLDDYDIRDIQIASLRKHISMVPQEPVLFSGTIAQNIVYGRSGATPAQIIDAAQAAELESFILELPEKYEAPVGERGSNLSGGQKQRLAFAMALLTNPSILILDDTTSALDAKTEARIQQTLERIMKARTTFVITHRISTAMRADRILVLDNGRMVGWGRHEDLLREDGVYRRIYEQQLTGSQTAPEEADEEVVETL